jgi:hypothetical protein
MGLEEFWFYLDTGVIVLFVFVYYFGRSARGGGVYGVSFTSPSFS